MTTPLDIKLVLSKFLKGAVFGAGSALFSVDLSGFALNSVDGYHKLGIIALVAVIAGALHGIWNIGKQIFAPDSL